MYFFYFTFTFPYICSQHANMTAMFNIQLYLNWIMVLLCSAPMIRHLTSKARIITVAQEAWTPRFLTSSPFTFSLSFAATTLASSLPHTLGSCTVLWSQSSRLLLQRITVSICSQGLSAPAVRTLLKVTSLRDFPSHLIYNCTLVYCHQSLQIAFLALFIFSNYHFLNEYVLYLFLCIFLTIVFIYH